MEKMFNKLSDALFSQLSIDETLTISFFGENSQFIRMNNSKIRQTGLVDDAGLELKFIRESEGLCWRIYYVWKF